MSPLEISMTYMDVFFNSADMHQLRPLLADNLVFRGPLFKSDTAGRFIEAMTSDPPENCAYEIIQTYENETSACIVFRFSKAGIRSVMTQVFEISGGKIDKILLIFDARPFSGQ